MKIKLRRIFFYSVMLIFTSNTTYAEKITIKNLGYTGSVIEGDQTQGWIRVVTLNNNMGSSSFIEQEKTQTFDLDFSKNPETQFIITGVKIIKEKIEGQEKENRLYYTCIPSLSLQGNSKFKDGKTLEISWDFSCTTPFKKENTTCKCTYKHSWKE